MDEINEILRPAWGAEKWIAEGWEKITAEEKTIIKKRMDALFKDGLPFELHHEKLLYIHTFSFLAQLEVLAIQIPLRFEDQMSNPKYKQQMRTQLLDEIFHGMVFTKIVYLLCMPYSYPPDYNESLEKICNFIRSEECPQAGIVLLNLVAEGWIEEIFKYFYQLDIAPRVFKVILDDEHRHVCEADLYRDIGIPAKDLLKTKLNNLEKLLIDALLLEPKYSMAISELMGKKLNYNFMEILNQKHITQLKKIQMLPGKYWSLFSRMAKIPRELKLNDNKIEQELSPIKKIYLTQWDTPSDPTMVGHFDIDVSYLKFFEKKYPSSTLTTLSLQAISQMLSENSELRASLSFNKKVVAQHAYVAIIVKLPGCNDHLGNIVFRDCHTMPIAVISNKIKKAIEIMELCYKIREQMELQNPELRTKLNKVLYDYSEDVYPYPLTGSKFVSLSNIGFCGYKQAKSPLLKYESLKFTLLTVERKPVWNNNTQTFEPKDLLPVAASADHRIIDGYHPVPKKLQAAYDLMFEKMLAESKEPSNTKDALELDDNFMENLYEFLSNNMELGHRLLSFLQTVWYDYVQIDELIKLTEDAVV